MFGLLLLWALLSSGSSSSSSSTPTPQKKLVTMGPTKVFLPPAESIPRAQRGLAPVEVAIVAAGMLLMTALGVVVGVYFGRHGF